MCQQNEPPVRRFFCWANQGPSLCSVALTRPKLWKRRPCPPTFVWRQLVGVHMTEASSIAASAAVVTS